MGLLVPHATQRTGASGASERLGLRSARACDRGSARAAVGERLWSPEPSEIGVGTIWGLSKFARCA
jgi:hypothetical protein